MFSRQRNGDTKHSVPKLRLARKNVETCNDGAQTLFAAQGAGQSTEKSLFRLSKSELSSALVKHPAQQTTTRNTAATIDNQNAGR